MAEGLTLDDLDSLQHTSERFADQPDWARGPMADIFRRHGIPSGTSPADAAAIIEAGAENLGAGQSAWANPDEWAAGREAYARQGGTPAEVKQRMDESIYLLDPRTYEYMQKYGRDADFLNAVAQQPPAAPESAPPPVYDPSGMGDWQAMASAMDAARVDARQNNAVEFWENSRGNPLYRSGIASANYQRFGGLAPAVINAVSNPDTAAGNYVATATVPSNFLRMQGSGESATAGESYDAAQASRLAANRYRTTSPAPILDVPAGAPPKDIAKRLAELQREVGVAAPPLADERWQRTTGWTPPGALSDVGDLAIDVVDPTFVFPAAKIGKAAGSAGMALARGGRLGASAARAMAPALAGLAADTASDVGVGTGIQAAAGGVGGRSWGQYATGGGQPGEDFLYKDDAELAEAKDARKALRERLADDGSIESAEREAYQRMRRDGAISEPPKFYWGMSPSGPAY